MTIKEALAYQIRDIRVTCGDRWLVWNGKEWVVYERKRHAKTTKIVTVTDSEETAVWWLRSD